MEVQQMFILNKVEQKTCFENIIEVLELQNRISRRRIKMNRTLIIRRFFYGAGAEKGLMNKMRNR